MAEQEVVKKHRNAITNAQKIHLRSHHQSNPSLSFRSLAVWFEEKYGRKINVSTISRILSPHFAFLDDLQGRAMNSKRQRPENWPELEQALSEWIRRAQNQNMSLSQEIIRQKAKQFWPDIYPGKDTPQLSNGWLERFQSRHDIKLKNKSGDTEDSADDAVIQMIRIRQLLRAFAPRDIFSCDETGLFYKMIPDQNLSTRALHDRKKEQARMSMLFCCNADASERLPILFIGTSKQPASFSKAHINIENLDCLWRSNKQAWMTGEIFKEWLLWFDARMQGRKVVLLMDKFSAHQSAVQKVGPKLQNTLVISLPGFATKTYQPLEEGIINNWKAIWKRQWLRYMTSKFEAGVYPSMSMTVLTAIRWAITAWNLDVEAETIVNCFKKALEIEETDAEIDDSNLHREISTGLQTLKSRGWIHDVMDIYQFLNSADEQVTDGVIDIDSIVLSQFISSDDADEDNADMIETTPLVSAIEALEAIQKLRLFEEQRAKGDLKSLQFLTRYERIVERRVAEE